MTLNYKIQKIVRTRIATFDTFEVSMGKHHISAMLEFDVKESRAYIMINGLGSGEKLNSK